jgi:hypothetical protein
LTWIGEQAGGISRLNQQQVADNIDVDVPVGFIRDFACECGQVRPHIARMLPRFLRRSAIVVIDVARETIKELFRESTARCVAYFLIRLLAKSLGEKHSVIRERAGTSAQ